MKKNRDEERGGIPIWVHITAISVILAVLIFSGYKLIRWNMGTTQTTESDTGENYSVEVLDQIFLLSDEKKAGHEYDDVETVLFLGNDILTYDIKETGVVGQVAKISGATCINAGFPNTTVSQKNATVSADHALDAFSFVHIAECIANEDFSSMKEMEKEIDNPAYHLGVETLEEVDFNKVDTIVIFYDANDYLSLRTGMNPNDPYDKVTYSGALNQGIKLLQEKYPYIRLVCMSFPMCYAYDSSGQIVSGDRYDFGNGKLTTYLQFMIDNCGATGTSFIDNYYGTIDEDNSSTWLLDNVHVNSACNEYMARHYCKAIYGIGK